MQSKLHDTIRSNLSRVVARCLPPEWRAFGPDARVKVPGGACIQPDLVVVRDPTSHESDEAGGALLDPRVIVEVLSPESELEDRRDKFALCRSMPTVTEYILVCSEYRMINVFERQVDDRWALYDLHEADAVLKLHSPDIQLWLSDVYRGVEPFVPALADS